MIYRQLCGQYKGSLILLRDVIIVVIIERLWENLVYSKL